MLQAPAGAGPRPGVDRLLVIAVAALLVIGTLAVWSATSGRDDLTGGDPTLYLKKQLMNIAIGTVLGVLVLATDYRWVRLLAPLVYVASVVGLALVLAIGTTINGSRSWLFVAGMSLQPAEFAKLAVIVAMALFVAERSENAWRRRVGPIDVIGMLAIAALPAALILLQPDLGTMLVLAATVAGVLTIAGASRRWLFGLAGAAVLAAVVAVQVGFLADYQVNRFLAFTDPTLDPRGAGYNTTQARIAIGNGGVFGQGLFQGSQTRSGFVPEQHTDFIFTVIGEELGLVGAGVVIALLAVLIWRALVIAV
ncbi:FtsW/RodA/SpoVE family cell cycle protein, partial [Nocardioides massiliensis]